MTIDKLVFVGFNSRVAALDRSNGQLVWQWKCPDASGFVSLLVDLDRLLASVGGYTYCLDPLTGETIWNNPLKGFGTGVPSLASIWGSSASAILKIAQEAKNGAGMYAYGDGSDGGGNGGD